MYERFTDRSRKVMVLAYDESRRHGHEYVGTEHILVGLVQEGHGVAAHVLKTLGIDAADIRREAEKIVQHGPASPPAPPRSFLGRVCDALFGPPAARGGVPHTPTAMRVIEFSMQEARNLNHKYVGTEHLLLGLLREPEGVAHAILKNLGVEHDRVRREVLALLGHERSE